VDVTTAQGIRKSNSNSIKEKLALFTANPPAPTQQQTQRKSVDKPFVSLYETTLSLITKLYNIPDFEHFLFPGGVNSLLKGESTPVIDPISILWGCFRLGAPLCHLLNQLQPKQNLPVPDVSQIVTYNNVCKKCIYDFIVGVKQELGLAAPQVFSISEVYKDDTNGLVKVIGIVDLVLQEIQDRGLAPKPKPFPFSLGQSSKSPIDNWSRSIQELFTTERKYIESLSELMEFKTAAESKRIISNDLIHKIFSNLAELLDFQRRFLFSLEATLALPPEEQHIGAIFIQYEEGFQVYNAMCASYPNAINVVLQNQDALGKVGGIDPKALQSYLIKPVQRICRYPLMLKEIIKYSSSESYPFCNELKEAEVVMKRVTDQVNEVQRMEENKMLKAKLLDSIEDLQGMNGNDWGDLLLCDKFPMVAQDVEQLYGIYLFESLILCCKESLKDKRRSKHDTVMQDIKGKIYSTSISDVEDCSDPDHADFELKVFWNEGEESFMLKCRNIEQVQLWRDRISACATGNTSGIGTRRSADYMNMGKRSSFRRTVQSITAVRRVSHGHMEHDKKTISLPSISKLTKNEIGPRGSSIYFRKQDSGERYQSMMSPSISKTHEIPSVVPERRTSATNNPIRNQHARDREQHLPPKSPSSRKAPGPPLVSLPRPPSSALPPGPPSSNLSSAPPSGSLPPGPPSSNLSSAPLSSSLPPGPPTSALPHGPPISALPPGPPSAGLPPGPPTSALPPGPPSGKLHPGPPSSALPPGPPSGSLPPGPQSGDSSSLPHLKKKDQHSSKASKPGDIQTSYPVSRGPTSAGLKPPKSPLPQPPALSSAKAASNLPQTSKSMMSSAPVASGTLPMNPPGKSLSAVQNNRRPSRTFGSMLIKMKIHYGDLIFILAVPCHGAKYEEVLEKVERKIKICGASMPENRRINLKYRDDDGDFVTLNTDEDIDMAFNMARVSSDKGSIVIQAE